MSAVFPCSFDDTSRSVLIHEPRLPQPWINYLSNGTLHAFVSQAGGGLAWWKSPLASWTAQHKPGMTSFLARRCSCAVLLDLFIAPGTDTLIWDLTLTNHSAEEIHIDIFGYVEFGLPDWKQDTDWACYVKHNLQTEFDPEARAITYLYRYFHFNPHLADCPLVYFGASDPELSFDGDRDAFTGPYRDERNPVAVERNRCSDSTSLCGDPCGALQCPATIPAAGTNRLQFFLGGAPQASQHAAGVRTLGFRDTCQDMLAIAYRKPEWATHVFRYLISQQYEDGHAPHQGNPEEKGPAESRVHIDNALWLPMVAYAIICETGNRSLLGQRLPWLSAQDNLSPIGSATVWEHLLRITDFMEANLGRHGVPLTDKGDWNDSIGKFSRKGQGESLFAAQQYVRILRLLEALAVARGESATSDRLAALREKQSNAIIDCTWDGAWWRRGFDDEGNALGSNACEHGKIWLNTQSWSVLCGVGTPEQQRRAMDSVHELLDTRECGIRKLTPGFPSFPEVADPYSGYSPGCGENGAIFCHANTWAIIAETLLGRADRAWHYYRQLVPHLALQKVGLDRSNAEPYAWVSNIIGPENPKYGWANSPMHWFS